MEAGSIREALEVCRRGNTAGNSGDLEICSRRVYLKHGAIEFWRKGVGVT